MIWYDKNDESNSNMVSWNNTVIIWQGAILQAPKKATTSIVDVMQQQKQADSASVLNQSAPNFDGLSMVYQSSCFFLFEELT